MRRRLLAMALGAAAAFTTLPTAQAADPGARIYRRSCAVCHMADGSGAGAMQPALKGSAVVAGKPETLIRLLLFGADTALPKTRRRYSMPMPPFAHLTNDEIAAVLSHVRHELVEPPASPITKEQVAQERARP